MMEGLKDPCGDRVVKSLPPPPARALDEALLYPEGDKKKPDVAVLKKHLLREGKLHKQTLLDIIARVTEIYRSEPTLVKVRDPITVVGDIHGQYYDFVKLLDVGGDPMTTQTQYLFLGDYVDRGSYAIEVLMVLFCIKISLPKRVWMLRGNHECRQMSSFFNFRDECEAKYDTTVYNAFMECFDALPLACLINGKFLGVHGGISPDLVSLKQLDRTDRFAEPPREGVLCDLIWADPMDEANEANAKDVFVKNEVRGCSWFFTYDAATQFLHKNSLLSVIRAHEAQIEGYKMHKTNQATGFPTVITIFSAPNYCDVYNNKGAILKFDNNTLNILQFNFSAHPYHLPNFMDVFTWSLPFVVEKVTEMLYYMMQPSTDNEAEQEIDEKALPPAVQKIVRNSLSMEQNDVINLAARLAEGLEGAEAAREKPVMPTNEQLDAGERHDRLRKKVKTIARMARMFKTLRQENEAVIRLKGVCPGHRLPPGLLLAGKSGLATELDRFDHARSVDLRNELRPDT
mmetsp:Transcript_4604/g.11269  ORF Transcript_4604/g.11269 Transcript_4604/m.11269 type:complete len:515 (-) Transcript_4604:620-2164(-)|eukprot:CAMPEP_0178983962 /NCGR_PEP_ID=MMETSP0795-20121207/1346_1 /TAXON_ID=88552 /ORGANISM="Amoebophrya sp., Strain Ameob2" /LENGTH=514 /DNA_ID=CAMNT_0020674783 /DNA_START=216 /DNA_END=1760 /DNA_ORIENTATION=+